MKIIFTVFFLCLSISVLALDSRVKPGATFYVDFPSLGKTWAKKDARMGVYIPEDYSEDKSYPIFVWFGGGEGSDSPNPPKKIVGKKGFICVGVPYNSPEDKGKGDWGNTPWSYYTTMLDELARIVPNINPENRICGGFSSGGAAITSLIGRSEGFREYFYAFLPGGAGWPMGGLDKIKGRPMYAFMGKKDSRFGGYVRLEKEASAAGVDVTFLAFEGGHSMPSKHFGEMTAWIREKVILRQLPSLKVSLKKSVQSKKYGIAYKQAKKILEIVSNESPEGKEAEDVIAKVLPYGKSLAEKMNSDKVKLDTIKSFVHQWQGCEFVKVLEDKCNSIANQQLQKIISSRNVQTVYLKRFITYWDGFAAGDKAMEKLDSMAQEAMAKILESRNNNSGKFKALARLIKDWTPSNVVELAKTEQEKLAAEELKLIKELQERRQKSKLKSFAKDFSGTKAASEALSILDKK